LIPGFLRKIIDFFSDLWYAMTLIRGRTLLLGQPLEKVILNELDAGRFHEKEAAVENDSQWRKPAF
jgi:hypothetical protein